MRIYFLLPAIAITIIWLIFKAVMIIFIKKEFVLKREVVNLFYFISVMGIIGLTLFPIEIATGTEYDSPNNFVPFSSIKELLNHFYFMGPLKNILGNIILFIPLGFILVLKFKRINGMLTVIIVGLLSSTTIEIIQLLLPNRAFDVDDIILNVLGTMVGFLLLKLTSIEKIIGLSSIQKQLN
ncbi:MULTISPECIES: VanZ family protein [unclassified Bacillus (in: firmicutes)]|uniref:VanZ family protein n=1 Tax=unclassified Bacillus (in: firmicutes) TaxID=185979 RepID=UPI0008E5988C|nr:MULTISPECIES: VanZ family protein [unclassified Bacillus (in: firmicutes)]SFA69402.1 Glycopeptide antibiotics resistance protein [Bacillus sp. UNCCL13]SFQ58707.1 Glycopeptide antibiotics resistance protein [Bacillus sp. cl95]